MNSPDNHLRISYPIFTLALLFLAIYAPALRAQETVQQPLTAPPPLKIITREERTRLEGTNDPKTRIRTTIELAELRLARAEVLTSEQSYDGAAGELGKYEALIDDALDYLNPMVREKDKTRDLYKRLELALRAHGPRLTAIRRSTPLEYAVWVKELEEFARKGRTEALNSFYGHTVFREPKKSEERPTEKPLKNNAVPEKNP